jgi:threonine dehydrogenase-like Zn-dependent dehydrogenase
VIEGIADGRIPTEGVVTHQLPLEQYKEGLEMMKKGDKSLKILLVP